MVQRLRVYMFTAGGAGLILAPGTKILHTTWPGQKKNESERGDNDGDETILWWWLVVTVANKKPWLVAVVRFQKLSRPPTNGIREKKNPELNYQCFFFPGCKNYRWMVWLPASTPPGSTRKRTASLWIFKHRGMFSWQGKQHPLLIPKNALAFWGIVILTSGRGHNG